MENARDKIRESVLKRQEALIRFKIRKESFIHTKEQIIKDIEESGNICENTLEQSCKQEFN